MKVEKFNHVTHKQQVMHFDNGFSLSVASVFGFMEAGLMKDGQLVYDDKFVDVIRIDTQTLLDLIHYVSQLDKNHQTYSF